jgi:hypothetical protein
VYSACPPLTADAFEPMDASTTDSAVETALSDIIPGPPKLAFVLRMARDKASGRRFWGKAECAVERQLSAARAFCVAIFWETAGTTWRLPEGGAGRRKVGCGAAAVAASCPGAKQRGSSILGPSLNMQIDVLIAQEIKPHREKRNRRTCLPKNRSNELFCPCPCETTI